MCQRKSYFIVGLTDQYADGKAAKVWQLYIGDSEDRTTHYRQFVIEQLKNEIVKQFWMQRVGQGISRLIMNIIVPLKNYVKK